MALNLYRRHRPECEGGHPEDLRSGEWEERRKGWKRCDCVIHVSGTLGGTFSRRSTGRSTWDDARAYAATNFARDVLSVNDNLERALASIPAELREDDKLKGLVAGLEATMRELANVFQRNGITRITALGETLDPNRHQAMMEMPSADAAPGTIVQEMQSGWMIRDRLLRPALVGVAKAAD